MVNESLSLKGLHGEGRYKLNVGRWLGSILPTGWGPQEKEKVGWVSASTHCSLLPNSNHNLRRCLRLWPSCDITPPPPWRTVSFQTVSQEEPSFSKQRCQVFITAVKKSWVYQCFSLHADPGTATGTDSMTEGISPSCGVMSHRRWGMFPRRRTQLQSRQTHIVLYWPDSGSP